MNNISEKIKGFLTKSYKLLKQNILTTVLLLLIAGLVFAFFGFNATPDMSNHSYFTKISFGSELETEQVTLFKKDVAKIFKDNGYKNVSVSYEGKDSDNIILVEIGGNKQSDKTAIENNFAATKAAIKSKLNADNEFYNFKISDLNRYQSALTGKYVLNIVLPIIILVAVFGVYALIKLDMASFVALMAGLAHDLVLMLSLITIFRLRISSLINIVFIITAMLSLFINYSLLHQIKDVFKNGKNDKLTNSQIAIDKTYENLKSNHIITSTFILAGFAIALFASGLGQAVGLGAFIYGVIVVMYSSSVITPVIWSKLYNKENDLRLQRAIELKNKPKKEEDDIVV